MLSPMQSRVLEVLNVNLSLIFIENDEFQLALCGTSYAHSSPQPGHLEGCCGIHEEFEQGKIQLAEDAIPTLGVFLCLDISFK